MRIFLLLLILVTMGACTPRLIPPPDPTQILPTLELLSPSATPAAQTDKIVALAVQDLANRLLLDSKAVRVLSIESTRWTDTSLGCPRPGEVYDQHTVPGYRLVLEANGVEYDYHTDMTGIILLCAEDNLPSFPATPDEIDDGQPWMPVN